MAKFGLSAAPGPFGYPNGSIKKGRGASFSFHSYSLQALPCFEPSRALHLHPEPPAVSHFSPVCCSHALLSTSAVRLACLVISALSPEATCARSCRTLRCRRVHNSPLPERRLSPLPLPPSPGPPHLCARTVHCRS